MYAARKWTRIKANERMKGEKMAWFMFYRCRACGKEFMRHFGFKYVKGKTCTLNEYILRGLYELEHENTGKNGEIVHKCTPLQYGIADYIGVRNKSDESEDKE
jgi:hypothetical protein